MLQHLLLIEDDGVQSLSQLKHVLSKLLGPRPYKLQGGGGSYATIRQWVCCGVVPCKLSQGFRYVGCSTFGLITNDMIASGLGFQLNHMHIQQRLDVSGLPPIVILHFRQF